MRYGWEKTRRTEMNTKPISIIYLFLSFKYLSKYVVTVCVFETFDSLVFSRFGLAYHFSFSWWLQQCVQCNLYSVRIKNDCQLPPFSLCLQIQIGLFIQCFVFGCWNAECLILCVLCVIKAQNEKFVCARMWWMLNWKQ